MILRSLPWIIAVASTGHWADAGETTASLSWVRLPEAESCIPAQALARAVEEHLGKSVFVSPSIAGLVIEGRVERVQRRFRATLHATRADGTDLGDRILESDPEDCRSLDENLALVLALMIDPDAVARRDPPQQPEPPSSTHEPPAPPPAPLPAPPTVIVKKERVLVPVERPAAEPEKPWRGEARVAGSLGWGVLPGTAVGFLASGQLEPPGMWPVAVTGYGWLEKEAEASNGGAEFSMLAASLTTCPAANLSDSLRADACAGLLGGAFRARGFGFDHVNEGTEPVVAVVASLHLFLDLAGPLYASLGTGLQAAVVRPRTVVFEPDGGKRDVFRMNVVGSVSEFGLGLRFQP